MPAPDIASGHRSRDQGPVDTTGERPPQSTRRLSNRYRGAARRRHSCRRCVPRRTVGCPRRLCRCRRLLCDLGVLDHRASRPRALQKWPDFLRGVLRPPSPTSPPFGPPRHRGHRRRLLRRPPPTASHGRGQGRAGQRLLRGELPLCPAGHELPERQWPGFAAPQLLVPRGGGTVLPGMAGAPRGGLPGLVAPTQASAPDFAGYGAAAVRGGRRGDGPRGGLFPRFLNLAHSGQRAVGLLLAPHPSLGTGRRRPAGSRCTATSSAATAVDVRAQLGRHRGHCLLGRGVHGSHPVSGHGGPRPGSRRRRRGGRRLRPLPTGRRLAVGPLADAGHRAGLLHLVPLALAGIGPRARGRRAIP